MEGLWGAETSRQRFSEKQNTEVEFDPIAIRFQ